jgi:hypothetical protein
LRPARDAASAVAIAGADTVGSVSRHRCAGKDTVDAACGRCAAWIADQSIAMAVRAVGARDRRGLAGRGDAENGSLR